MLNVVSITADEVWAVCKSLLHVMGIDENMSTEDIVQSLENSYTQLVKNNAKFHREGYSISGFIRTTDPIEMSTEEYIKKSK